MYGSMSILSGQSSADQAGTRPTSTSVVQGLYSIRTIQAGARLILPQNGINNAEVKTDLLPVDSDIAVDLGYAAFQSLV